MSKASNQEQDELSGQHFVGQVLYRLLPYLRPKILLFLFCLSLVFTGTAISLYAPFLLGRMIDEALLAKNLPRLYQLVFLFGALELIRITVVFTQNILLQKLGQFIMHAIRSDLFSRLTRMPVPFFDQNPVGRLVTRVTNDTANLAELFNAGFISFFADLALIIGVLSIMVAIHWRLGLLGISAFPFMIFCMTYFSGRLQAAFRGSRRTLAMLNGFFAERMGGMPIIQMMGRESYEQSRFQELSLEYRSRQFATVHIYSLFHPAITILSAVSMVFVIFYGAKIVNSGQLAVGVFVAFLAYIQTLYQPVRSITDKYNIYLAAMASAERIFALLDLPEEEGLRREHDSSAQRRMAGDLQFKDVSFRYEALQEGGSQYSSRPQALKNISFHIRPGEQVAVVGATGAGKSTLISLLFRFYEPQLGQILLDGLSLQELDKRELRRRIGYVQQDVFVFAGTVRENLCLLAPEALDQKILEVAALTGFDSILAKIPLGLDGILDERGANLSLGERQILAVTRTLLQEPEILVLDEATASVDAESERKIQAATQSLTRGRTTIIIAHRLSTVRHVDRIFVFHQGQLVEEGKHEALLAQRANYAKLIELQEI